MKPLAMDCARSPPHSQGAAGAGVHAALPKVGQHRSEGQGCRVPEVLQGLQKDVVALEVKVDHLLRLKSLHTEMLASV